MRSIVSNRVYLGESRGGRGYVNPKAHEAIVSKGEWQAANRRKGEQPPTRGGNEGRLLTGLVYCASCGGRMVTDVSRKDGVLHPIYRCRTRVSGRKACDQPATVSAGKIEPYLEQVFLEALGDSEVVNVSEESEFRQAQEALEAAEAALAEFEQAWQAEGLSAATAARMAAKLEQEREAALQSVAELSVEPDLPKIEGPLAKAYPKLSIPEKRQLLAQVFARVTIKPGRADIAARLGIELTDAHRSITATPPGRS